MICLLVKWVAQARNWASLQPNPSRAIPFRSKQYQKSMCWKKYWEGPTLNWTVTKCSIQCKITLRWAYDFFSGKQNTSSGRQQTAPAAEPSHGNRNSLASSSQITVSKQNEAPAADPITPSVPVSSKVIMTFISLRLNIDHICITTLYELKIKSASIVDIFLGGGLAAKVPWKKRQIKTNIL